MRNRLAIIGAGGQGRVVADIALKCDYKEIIFLDDKVKGSCLGFPVAGLSSDAEKFDDGKTDFVVAIGDIAAHRRIAEQYSLNWASLVHPSAQIAIGVTLGRGTVVMAGAVINTNARIGEHCIINSGAVVEHDGLLGDYIHISPRAALGGTVCVGDNTHIGIGAVIKNNISICENCIIGAGAVVVNSIDECGVYVGVPAKILG